MYRDRVFCDIDIKFPAKLRQLWKSLAKLIRLEMAHIEKDVRVVGLADRLDECPADEITRRQLKVRVIILHEAISGAIDQIGAFAANGLGDQRAAGSRDVENGGMKLDKFEIRDARVGLLEPVLSGRCDIALGNRFLSNRSNVPPFRKVVLQLGRLFTYLTSGLRVGDCHNGYRAFSRKGAEAIHMKQDRMAHASEIYDQIKSARLAYVEVPVTIRYTAETLAKGQKLSNSLSVLFHYLYGKIAQ